METEWKNDRITEKWIENHSEELKDIKSMTPQRLGEACTYCRTWDNPFMEESLTRSGHINKFRSTFDEKEKRKIINASCNYHGFKLY